jgi:stage II sporulation protein AA (anti-sigma F factor antagonist)
MAGVTRVFRGIYVETARKAQVEAGAFTIGRSGRILFPGFARWCMTDAVEAGLDGPVGIRTIEGTDAVVLTVAETNLNYATADDLKVSLQGAVSELFEGSNGLRIVLSLENVEVLDSSGLALIISLKKKVETEGGSLVLCGMNEMIRRLFELTGLSRAFHLAGTEEEAAGAA